MNRRNFIGCCGGGFLAYALRHEAGGLLFGQDAKRAKACIVLWMSGGPSQIDTFDPKPNAANGGGVKAIETSAKEIRISENLPRLATQMKHLSVVRSMTSREGEHQRATYLLHTGRPPLEGFAHPPAGCIVSKEISADPVKMPRYVTIGAPAFGPSLLGADHSAFALDDPGQALERIRQLQSKRARFKLLDELGREFEQSHPSDLLKQREGIVERTAALLDTQFPAALDLSKEPDDLRDRYGRTAFGQNCLAARRLVEAGVRFVEVEHGSWDTHQQNGPQTKQLCATLDPGFATLVEDLAKRGLLESTVVLWMGEFGRTPTINADRGRDHFPAAFSAVLGGGGIAGGRVFGETSNGGDAIAKDPVQVPDLFATVFDRFGFDPAKKYRGDGGTIVKMTEGGVPVKALF
jgi:hypothetical protein